MQKCPGKVLHSDGTYYHPTIPGQKQVKYRETEISVEVPAFRFKRSVTCPICGEAFEVVIWGARLHALNSVLLSGFFFCLFAGVGWAIYAADIGEENLWFPRLLMFGFAPLFAGNLIHTMIIGSIPSAHLPDSQKDVREGGAHQLNLEPKGHPRVYLWFIGSAELVGIILWFQFS